MEIALPDKRHGPLPAAFIGAGRLQQPVGKAKVRNRQHRLGREEREAQRRQLRYLPDFLRPQRPDALEAALRDLSEMAVAAAGAIYVLPVADPRDLIAPVRQALDDGERHVGLERAQAPVGVGEGDHPVG